MGQAAAASNSGSTVVPLGPAPTSAAAAPSADDLLAQLAGEEIDRLLAETEDGGPITARTPEPDVAPAPDAAPATEPGASAIDSSIETVEKMGDQLDALLKEIEAPKPAAPQAETAPEVPATMVTIAQLGAAQLDAAQLGATSNSEVQALLGEESAVAIDVADDGSPMPIYVRGLEMINAPFDAMPIGFRELLGKVAILTLFNSLAVLLYVLIFRRH